MANKVEIMVDIGRCNTKIIAYKRPLSGLTVLDFSMFSTPHNVFNETEEDNLNMSPEFIFELKKSIADMHVKPEFISFTISSPSIIMREITLPKVDENQLKTMIALETPKHFMIDIKDFTIDYKILGTKNQRDSELYVVMLVAAPLSMVESYLLMSQSCGYKIKKIDFNNSSIGKIEVAEQYSPVEDNLTYAFVDIGHSRINVSIEKQGALMYSRSLSYGCNEYQKAIESVLELNYEETMSTLKSYDLTLSTKDNQSPEPLDAAMSEVTENIVESLTRIFDFHSSRELSNRLDKIVLLGGGSYLKNIDLVLSDQLHIDVQVVREFHNVKTEKNLDRFHADRAYYANCIGAAL